MTRALDRVERRVPSGDEAHHGDARTSLQRADQRDARAEQLARSSGLERDDTAQRRAGGRGAEIALRAPETVELVARQVHTAAAVVLADVLEVLDHLERGAHVVGPRDVDGRIGVEHPQHEAAHGIRGQRAVLAELGPRLVAVDDLVATVRLDEPAERLGRHRAGVDRRREPAENRVAGVAPEGTSELRLEPVELGQPVAHGLVADVVGEAGEAVDREQVPPDPLRDEPRRDREVLIRGTGRYPPHVGERAGDIGNLGNGRCSRLRHGASYVECLRLAGHHACIRRGATASGRRATDIMRHRGRGRSGGPERAPPAGRAPVLRCHRCRTPPARRSRRARWLRAPQPPRRAHDAPGSHGR